VRLANASETTPDQSHVVLVHKVDPDAAENAATGAQAGLHVTSWRGPLKTVPPPTTGTVKPCVDAGVLRDQASVSVEALERVSVVSAAL
jgi:hypothetical protein